MADSELVDERDEVINTTHRYNRYCRAEHPDGRKCSLYSPHEGKHKPKQGTERDRW